MSTSTVWCLVFVGTVAVTVGLVLLGWREVDRAMVQAQDMLAEEDW